MERAPPCSSRVVEVLLYLDYVVLQYVICVGVGPSDRRIN